MQLDRELPDVIILKDGYFLEKYTYNKSTKADLLMINYSLKRLMEDDIILGMLDIVTWVNSLPAGHNFMWRLENANGITQATELVHIDKDVLKNPVARTKNFVQANIYNVGMGLTEAAVVAHSSK
ncbi:MAG: hypothetical protein DDT31_00228 [Syntrophomonadaceae bacterium]|nr:hypothetical protein [Bacillota bacterium]